jgi:hypothetical protein
MGALSSDDVLDRLKKIITEKQNLNGNKCGTTPTSLSEEMNIDLNEVKILLNKLLEKKFIKIREGINQKLIFLNANYH